MSHRILIHGPSGAGCSTVGRALTTQLASQHFDADDFYWLPTDPPFREKRPVQDRYGLMQAMFLQRPDWVLSGSIASWDETAKDRLTHVFRLELDKDVRRARLERRETIRHGNDALKGGAFYQEAQDLISWSDGYEAGDRPGRSLARHQVWEETLSCPVTLLDSSQPVSMVVAEMLMHLDREAANA